MNTLITTVPGVNADVYTLTHRHLFTNTATARAIHASAIIDGTKSRDLGNTSDIAQLRAGKIMGKVTTGGKYRPSIIGTLGTATTAATVTSVTVTAAVATEVARLITAAGGNVTLKLVGPPSAGGTVATTSITVTAASGTTLTVSSVTTPVHIIGSFIMPGDGAETPVTFIPDGYGMPVTNASGSSVDQMLSPFYNGGDIDVSQIIDYPSDSSLKTWLKAQLRTSADFTFSDDR